MELLYLVKWVHVLSGAVLFGTGTGIAFFMVQAQPSADVRVIAHTARTVVVADFLFTAVAMIVQPATGFWLLQAYGLPLGEPWVALSLALYGVIAAFWLPVVFIQIRLARLAAEAAGSGGDLPASYRRLYRLWFACGFPAFTAILVIYWLMIAKPSF